MSLLELQEVTSPLLQPSNRTIPKTLWQKLSEYLESNPHLFAFPVENLIHRFDLGDSAVVLHEDEIVSHLSSIAVLHQGRVKIGDTLVKTIPELSGSVSAHLLLSEWTHSGFRRKGLITVLRRVLFDRFNTGNSFVMSISNPVVYRSLVEKFSCSKVSKGNIPYVQALTVISSRMGQQIAPEILNEQIFWVSNYDLAKRLNEQIPAATNLPVAEWRQLLGVTTTWSD